MRLADQADLQAEWASARNVFGPIRRNAPTAEPEPVVEVRDEAA